MEKYISHSYTDIWLVETRGQNGRWSHSRDLEIKKKGKLTARKDHGDTRGSHTLELSRSSRVKTGPLCRRACELRVSEAGPWAARSAEQRGVLLAGQVSFTPRDSTARCSCRPASHPPARLLVGHWSVRNFCSAWSTQTSTFKTRPSTFKALTWPFRSSPFKKSPFPRLCLFPIFLEPSCRGSVPTIPARLATHPGPSWPRSARSRQPPLLSTVIQVSSPTHCSIGAAWCAGPWGACLVHSGLHHTTPNTVKPFLHWPGLLHHSHRQRSGSAHELRINKEVLTPLLRCKANTAYILTHLKYC